MPQFPRETLCSLNSTQGADEEATRLGTRHCRKSSVRAGGVKNAHALVKQLRGFQAHSGGQNPKKQRCRCDGCTRCFAYKHFWILSCRGRGFGAAAGGLFDKSGRKHGKGAVTCSFGCAKICLRQLTHITQSVRDDDPMEAEGMTLGWKRT